MANNHLLIDKKIMQQFVQISNKRNEEVLNQHIRDAQYIDLRNLICEKYFNLILQDKKEFRDLLKGGSYSYKDTVYINYGLEIVLTYFAYARYVLNGSHNDTAFGMVVKQTDHSQQVSDKALRSIYTFNRQNAMTYWENVRAFLRRSNFKDYNKICANYCNNGTGENINQPFYLGKI